MPTFSVAELVEALKAMPQDATVEISYEATGTDQIEVRLEQGLVLIEDARR